MKSPVKLWMIECFEAAAAERVKVSPNTMRSVPKTTRSPIRSMRLLRRSRDRKAIFTVTTSLPPGLGAGKQAVADIYHAPRVLHDVRVMR
jgi:hypothetical protein